MTNKREPGYYWVKMGEKWEVAELFPILHKNKMVWYRTGYESKYVDSELDEIGSRISPEQKYTEEDLKDAWCWGRNYERAEEFAHKTGCENNSADFEYWLKQRKEEQKGVSGMTGETNPDISYMIDEHGNHVKCFKGIPIKEEEK